jgi:uncharacterized repeat protein (TIGR03803 family)
MEVKARWCIVVTAFVLSGCSNVELGSPLNGTNSTVVLNKQERGTRRPVRPLAFTENVVYSFSAPRSYDYSGPVGPLFIGSAGDVYGTISHFNSQAAGIVFRLTTGGTFQVLHSFPSESGGLDGVIRTSSGAIFGSSEFGGSSKNGVVFMLTATGSNSWNEAKLHEFNGCWKNYVSEDGCNPIGPLVSDSSGNLYGTTCCGGLYKLHLCPAFNGEYYGSYYCGTVFKLTPEASGYSYSVIYRFKGGADGYWPTGGLAVDSDGNVYGTTLFGGAYGSSTKCGSVASGSFTDYGCGTVFELVPVGSSYSKRTLYEFQGGSDDGSQPGAGVAIGFGIAEGPGAVSNTLYGTTELGGSHGSGTIYKLQLSGSGNTETILYSFGSTVALVSGALLSSGYLYTTTNGTSTTDGFGAVQQTDLSSATTKTIYTFTGAPDGSEPATPATLNFSYDPFPPATSYLAINGNGALYGITAYGGTTGLSSGACYRASVPVYSGCGTIFKLTPSGSERRR